MTDYKKLYFSLFNSLSEIKECIEKGDYEAAAAKIEIAQFSAEDEYISQ